MQSALRFFIILLPVLTITSSCQNKSNNALSYIKKDGKELIMCDIDKITETKTIKLSELVESSNVVRLVTDINALVGNTFYRKYSDNFLFMADMQNKLYMFDMNGQFINKWLPGRGPAEFLIPDIPNVIGNTLFVQDPLQQKLLWYELNGKGSGAIKLSRENTRSIILPDSMILSFVKKLNPGDAEGVILQNFNGNIQQEIKRESKINTTFRLIGEDVTFYKKGKGWNVHYPVNDTLFYYNLTENSLSPVAVFESSSNNKIKTRLYKEREETKLDSMLEELRGIVNIVPEWENDRYYFLSIYSYGDESDPAMPWYLAKRKICLVDKKEKIAFYAKIVNDLWGNIPFSPMGNGAFWDNTVIQDFSPVSLNRQLSKILEENGNSLDKDMTHKIKDLLSSIKENDNSIVFVYHLK